MKMDIARYMLTVLFTPLPLSYLDKAALRAMLSSVGAYRAALGMSHFSCQEGAFVIGRGLDATAIAWPSPLWMMCFRIVEAGCA